MNHTFRIEQIFLYFGSGYTNPAIRVHYKNSECKSCIFDFEQILHHMYVSLHSKVAIIMKMVVLVKIIGCVCHLQKDEIFS